MRIALTAIASLTACQAAEEPRQPAPEKKTAAPAPVPAAASKLPAPPSAREPSPPGRAFGEAAAAAELLRTYFEHIEAGRFADAYRLRETGGTGADAAAFAAHFARYREHRATVGAPSQVAHANGWLYLEVPVHIYGRKQDGAPFASAGTVTMRRRAEGGQWRIYTGS